MNNFRKISSGMATAFFIAILASTSVQAEPLKLRLSVESTPGSSTQHMLASFRDALKIEMGDDVAIEYFDSGTLGDEIVHMQQVRTGQLDVIPIGSDAVQLDAKFAVFDIPFLFSSRDKVSAVLDGPIGDELDASFQKAAGLKVLSYGEIGFRQLAPEDGKRERRRVNGAPEAFPQIRHRAQVVLVGVG